MKTAALTLLTLLSTLACLPQVQATPTPPASLVPVAIGDTRSALPKDWYRQAVFMEIYVRGYKDSDGDGIGDFKGLTAKLDYLADLGIRGIWLMPIMQSHDKDHGYAVTDYRNVDADYGSLADFKTLLHEAHKRGIGIILDYVMGLSSIHHPLFQDSNQQLGGKRDWYVWSKTPKSWTNWYGSPTWHKGLNGYYYGVFWEQMPDFNLRNPDVVRFHQDNLRYWLNLGVDGFRFDSVGTLFENGPNAYLNQPENHSFLQQQIQPTVHAYQHRFMVCENPDGVIETAHSCGAAFYFGFQKPLLDTVRSARVNPALLERLQTAPMQQMATLLSNHDAYAGDRVNAQLNGDTTQNKLAIATLLTLPGIPFLYYGEEIGMGHSINPGDPDPDHLLRGPMSWQGNSQGAGFTSGLPFRQPAENVMSHNVTQEQQDPGSLWHYYRKLIQLRNQHPALHSGDLLLLPSAAPDVLSFWRQAGDERLLVVINYSAQSKMLELPGSTPCLRPLNGQDSIHDQRLTLLPQTAEIYRPCP